MSPAYWQKLSPETYNSSNISLIWYEKNTVNHQKECCVLQVFNCISLIGLAIKYPNLVEDNFRFQAIEIVVYLSVPLYEIVVPLLFEN